MRISILVTNERPAGHPIRRSKALADTVRQGRDAPLEERWVQGGRSSIPPERLRQARVLQALFTVRSDRQRCARRQTDLMFRWCIGLPPEQAGFAASAFSRNQARLLRQAVADLFFAAVVALAKPHRWVSNDHFPVGGTLLQAWASLKSFKPKGTARGRQSLD